MHFLPFIKTGFVVKMRQGSLYFKLVILFNFLLIHSTLTAPLTTITTNDINQNDSTTIASTAITDNTPTSSVSSAEISHVIKQELDNNKEINDKTGTLSNNINNNKKNYDNDYDTVNEIKDDEEKHYEKNALSNDMTRNKDYESRGSSRVNDKLKEVSLSLSETSTAAMTVDDLLASSSLESKLFRLKLNGPLSMVNFSKLLYRFRCDQNRGWNNNSCSKYHRKYVGTTEYGPPK